MSAMISGECVEHAQARRTFLHRGVSLQSRAVMLGAQLGIRSLVAAWMAAPDFPWPTGWVDDAARWLPRPRRAHSRTIALPHCRAEWVRADGAGRARAILYLHGGAFLMS
jgi:acetyl esterase/lipase